MTARLTRVGVAGVLTTLAIVAPCAAWYVSGARSATQEAQRAESEPLAQARTEAQRLAHLLKLRLEAIRHTESNRSHLDYQALTEFEAGDCTREVRLNSTLALGSGDPLIWTHFQMDEVGQLSLPTLSGETMRTRDRTGRSIELAIYEELECASSYRLPTLPMQAPRADDRVVHSSDGTTVVGPLSWYTINVKDQPALVALRKVSGSSAELTQGFVILGETLDALLADGPSRAAVRPGVPDGAPEALLPIDRENWTVVVDARDALRAAAHEARQIRRGFRLRFAGGALAALIAGGLLIGLVWQSDRLARRQSQFAASAAHELRTPLAGLQLYGEMLNADLGNPANRRKYAGRIADEADRLGRVVSNVLGYSRLEHGGLQVHPERGDLSGEVDAAVARIRPAIAARGATLELDVGQRPLLARFDRDAVHQILENLVDNAEKYSRDAPDRTIRVAVETNGAGPVLSVSDRGAGVPTSLRRKLFRPFVRDEAAERPAGLGLGLALVASLARAQGGHVSHAPLEGGGSRFSVTFPG